MALSWKKIALVISALKADGITAAFAKINDDRELHVNDEGLRANQSGYNPTTPTYVTQPDFPDTGNSVLLTDASAVPYSGTPIDLRDPNNPTYRRFIGQFVLLGGTESLGGTFTFNYSPDDGAGAPVLPAEISVTRTIGDFKEDRDFPLKEAGDWFWVEFTPSRTLTAGEFVFIETTHHTQDPPEFVRLADQEIERQNAAMGKIFSYAKGFGPDGKSVNAAYTQQGAQLTGLFGVEPSQAGTLPTEGIRDEKSYKFSDVDPEEVFIVGDLDNGGGTVTTRPNDGQAVWATDTGAFSIINRRTSTPINYDSGHEIRFEWTMEYPTSPTQTDGFYVIGMGNAAGTEGISIGFFGNQFGINHRRNGVDDFAPFGAWNVEKCIAEDGSLFTAFGQPIAFNPNGNYVYRIRFKWHGVGTIFIDIESPDGYYINVHKFIFAGGSGSSLADPDVFIGIALINGAVGESIELRSASWRIGHVTSEPSRFEQLLTRRLDDGDELRLDVEPTSLDYYLGVSEDSTPTTSTSWDVMRIYLSATRNPSRIRFRKNIAWDDRTSGW